jgi:hypothetical protein
MTPAEQILPKFQKRQQVVAHPPSLVVPPDEAARHPLMPFVPREAEMVADLVFEEGPVELLLLMRRVLVDLVRPPFLAKTTLQRIHDCWVTLQAEQQCWHPS